MASNAASSVQFYVNGTEIARERARKTDRTPSADLRAQLTPQCRRLVGARGFEPQTPCAQGSDRNTISLARLAFLYVVVHGFGPSLSAFGPKLDPRFDSAVSLFTGSRRLPHCA